MDDLKALAIGVFGGLIVIGLSKIFRSYQKMSLQDDIELIEYEKNHLAEMKRSSIEMNRSSFRSLFTVLMLIALAKIVPAIFQFTDIGIICKTGEVIALILWTGVLALAIKYWRRYDNLKNFKQATAKLDEKLALLKSKHENN